MKRSRLRAFLVAAFGAALLLPAQAPRSTRDGVYTDRQATRGQAGYKTGCASCHGDELQGSGAATPPLAGEDFVNTWKDQTLEDLLDRMQTTMPADHPGKLTRAENVDILAFILKANKLPPGNTELPSDAGLLKTIKFEGPKQ